MIKHALGFLQVEKKKKLRGTNSVIKGVHVVDNQYTSEQKKKKKKKKLNK